MKIFITNMYMYIVHTSLKTTMYKQTSEITTEHV